MPLDHPPTTAPAPPNAPQYCYPLRPDRYHTQETTSIREAREVLLQELMRCSAELLSPILDDTVQELADELQKVAIKHAGQADAPAWQRTAARMQREQSVLVAKVLCGCETRALAAFPPFPGSHFDMRSGLMLTEDDELQDRLAVDRAALAIQRLHSALCEQFQRRLITLNGGRPLRGEHAPMSPAAIATELNELLLMCGIPHAQREFTLEAFARNLANASLRMYEGLDYLLEKWGVFPAHTSDLGEFRPRRVASDPPERTESVVLVSLDQICAALAARRRSIGAVESSSGGALLSGEALDRVLAQLQHSRTEHTISLRDHIAAYRMPDEPDGPPPDLQRQADDVIEFVGLVFKNLLRQVPTANRYQALITRLEIPTVRLALANPAFFSVPAHPGRRLLNLVGEIAFYWLDAKRSDAELHKLTRSVIDGILRQDTMSETLFAEAADSLSNSLDKNVRRARLFESRLVARATAQEKTDTARQRASAEVAPVCAVLPAGSTGRKFLETVWTDVLTLTYLRIGANSERWRDRSDAARWLVQRDSLRGVFTPQQFRQIVEQGVNLLGFRPAEATQLLEALLSPQALLAPPSTALLPVLNRPSVPAVGFAFPPVTVAADEMDGDMATPLTSAERRVVEQLRMLPSGCWFEFRRQDQTYERKKLAWFSTITERCLFIGADGQRATYRSFAGLARTIARDETRILYVAPRSWFDSAWATVTKGLQTFLGSDDASGTPTQAPE